jgi:hypothetical protein
MHGGTQHARGHPTCTGTPQNTETTGHDCPPTCLLPWQAQKDCTYNTHASLSLCHLWQTELDCPLQSIQHNQFQTISSLLWSHRRGNCRPITNNNRCHSWQNKNETINSGFTNDVHLDPESDLRKPNPKTLNPNP